MDEINLELTAVQQLAEAIVDCHEPKLLQAEDELKELTWVYQVPIALSRAFIFVWFSHSRVKQDLLLGELQKQNRRLEDAVGRARVHEMVIQWTMKIINFYRALLVSLCFSLGQSNKSLFW